MSEPFSHEAKMEAGQGVLNLFEAMEDEELQRHFLDARAAIEAAASNLKDQGFTRSQCSLALIGVVLGPVMDDE